MPRLPGASTPADEIIRSRSNPLVRHIRALKEKGQRGAAGLCLLEGGKLVEEALNAGVEVVEAAASPRFSRDPRGRALVDRLARKDVPLRLVDERLLASLSELETSPGLLAIARRPRFDEDALYRGVPLIVTAVGIQNPGNLGSLLRTAEAAGATGAYLAEGTADPLSWKSLRGSMGSALRLPHISGPSATEVIGRLKRRGILSVATVARGGVTYHQADFRRPVAFLFGSEGSGLPQTVLAEVDVRVTIPTREPVESLNVGVASGVLLFETARQRGT